LSVKFNIQKVLVAPLDWGLGHATRCIPIIRGLLDNGYEVVIAAEDLQASLLQKEFPSIPCLPLSGYRVRYSKSQWSLPFMLLGQLPRVAAIIKQEHRWLDGIIEQYQIDLVISDNRFGLSSKKIPCIFITHQLTIKAPFSWVEKILQRINYRFINRFTCCWVPDAQGEPNVAGVLSHPVKLPKVPVHYIGLLSRFHPQTVTRKYDYCILLSGPEPQRTLLENKLMEGLAEVNGKILLVRGKPGSEEEFNVPENVEVKNHLPTGEMQQALLQSEYIVSRSGYTTVMELLSLHKKSILIPTPGQTEQEYLAEKLQNAKVCISVSQHRLNCVEHFALVKQFGYQFSDINVFIAGDVTALLRASI